MLSGFIRTTKKHPDWGAFFVEFVITLDAKFQWRCKHTICLVVSIISLFGQKGDINLQVLLDGH